MKGKAIERTRDPTVPVDPDLGPAAMLPCSRGRPISKRMRT